MGYKICWYLKVSFGFAFRATAARVAHPFRFFFPSPHNWVAHAFCANAAFFAASSKSVGFPYPVPHLTKRAAGRNGQSKESPAGPVLPCWRASLPSAGHSKVKASPSRLRNARQANQFLSAEGLPCSVAKRATHNISSIAI